MAQVLANVTHKNRLVLLGFGSFLDQLEPYGREDVAPRPVRGVTRAAPPRCGRGAWFEKGHLIFKGYVKLVVHMGGKFEM